MIVSSRYEVGVPQANGRSYIALICEDEAGNVYRDERGPVDVSATDLDALLARRVAELESAIAANAVVPFERGE